jgi:hypothetical protein
MGVGFGGGERSLGDEGWHGNSIFGVFVEEMRVSRGVEGVDQGSRALARGVQGGEGVGKVTARRVMRSGVGLVGLGWSCNGLGSPRRGSTPAHPQDTPFAPPAPPAKNMNDPPAASRSAAAQRLPPPSAAASSCPSRGRAIGLKSSARA